MLTAAVAVAVPALVASTVNASAVGGKPTLDPAAVKPFLAQLPDRSHVRSRAVAHSLAELTSTVRSTGGGFPNNTAWVLTAGHCAQNKSNFTPTRHNGTPVVNQHGVEKYLYPYDYQFVQYVDQAIADKWLNSQTPHNEVLLYCRPGGLDSTQACNGEDSVSANQPITGIHPLADIKPGWVVCADSSASNKRNYPQAVDSGAGVDYLPGQNSSGPCTSGEANNYSPIGTILDDVNAFSGGKGAHFEVITTPNG